MLTNQPKNKKSPAKKSPAKKRTIKKRTTKKRKAPKIKLAKNKVYAAAAIIISICVLSLAMSVFLAREPERHNPPAEMQVAKSENSAPQKNPPAKTEIPPAQAKIPQVQEKLPQKAKKNQLPKPESKVQSQKAEAKTKNQTRQPELASVKLESAAKIQENLPPVKKVPHPQAAVAPKPEVKSQKSQAVSYKPQDKIPADKRQLSLFNIPPAKRGATLVFVIDDGGQNVWNVKKYVSLPFPITIAVLPKLPHSRECADAVRAAGKELMLHQPMQAVNLNINPGAGKISPTMSTYEIAAVIKENLAELGPGVKGFNNHEGSLITGDVIKMGAVLETAAERGLYFLDSRTTSASMARQAAIERDMSILERNAPFLDNAVNRDQMLSEILKALEVANKAGHAIIIGHVDKSAAILPDLLKEMYPELVRAGYKFATPSQIR